MTKNTRIGIIGCGWIAEKMAITLQGMKGVEAYAIASRDLSKAKPFAERWNFTRAYGSYEEMLDDECVDLVYIATPHSHHYTHTRLSLLKGKPVLCEKAFTANAKEAEELIQLAKEKNLFLTEAIWTRYMPLSLTISELVNKGVIGNPKLLTANLCYPNFHKERMHKPELAGGALLDLGVYTLNFAAMIFGTNIIRTTSTCIKSDTVYDSEYRLTSIYECPPQITGYEYQVYASIEAMEKGWLESPYMPHQETLRIMKQMDELRMEWGVTYPSDK